MSSPKIKKRPHLFMRMKAKRILRQQNEGLLSTSEACRQLDDLMMEGAGFLIFCSDSTGLTASWDPDLMLFPTKDGQVSSSGIYARGPRRGEIVISSDGPECDPVVLAHFQELAKDPQLIKIS